MTDPLNGALSYQCSYEKPGHIFQALLSSIHKTLDGFIFLYLNHSIMLIICFQLVFIILKMNTFS